MGGLVDALSDSFGKDLAQKAGTEVKEIGTKALGSLERVASKSEAGQAFWKLFNEQYMQANREGVQQLTNKFGKSGPAMGQAGPTMTLPWRFIIKLLIWLKSLLMGRIVRE